MPRVVFDKKSVQRVRRQLRLTRTRARRAARQGVEEAGRIYLGVVRAVVSVPPIGGNATSHDLALRDLDHPYARRHGSPTISPQGGPAGFSRRDLLVHEVSGDLKQAVVGRFNKRRGEATITLDEGKAPHALFVVNGTDVMLPRDFIRGPMEDPAVLRMLRRAMLAGARDGWRRG